MVGEITHRTEGNKGTLTAYSQGNIAGELTYSLAPPSTLIIDHTQVEDNARGTGVGQQLVEYIIGYAKKNNYKILPLCPFAKALFGKNKQWNYILK